MLLSFYTKIMFQCTGNLEEKKVINYFQAHIEKLTKIFFFVAVLNPYVIILSFLFQRHIFPNNYLMCCPYNNRDVNFSNVLCFEF